MLSSVLENLDPKELILICQANQDFSVVCNDDNFWKTNVVTDYKVLYNLEPNWRTLYHDLTFKKARTLSIKVDDKLVGTGYQYPEKKTIEKYITNFFKSTKSSTLYKDGLELFIDKYDNILAIKDLSNQNNFTRVADYSDDKIRTINIITNKKEIKRILDNL